MTRNKLIRQLEIQNYQQWLVNFESCQLEELKRKTLIFQEKFSQLKQQKSVVNILLVSQDLLTFIATVIASLTAKCYLFLGNNQWQKREWEQVFNLMTPDLIIGNLPESYLGHHNSLENHQLSLEHGLIMIATGGTSGKIKFAIHTEETLTNSVKAFAHYFGLKQINSCSVLPLYHVSGLMQLWRSFLTGGKFYSLNYPQLKIGNLPFFDQENYLLSLVPTQLQYLLEKSPIWLKKFKIILLGGAKPWPQLLKLAKAYQIKLAPVYGMTETASNIVALKPEDFLAGNLSNGQVLNHSQIEIKNSENHLLNGGEIGVIQLKSQSLCLGYYPHLRENNQNFITDDLGYFDEDGYLYIVGRNSQKIITGGENVNPTEVETVILATKLVKDVCIMGVADPQWGEIVTAVYVPCHEQISDIMIRERIKNQLAKFKIPKSWHKVEEIPRNLQGKIDYLQLKLMINR